MTNNNKNILIDSKKGLKMVQSRKQADHTARNYQRIGCSHRQLLGFIKSSYNGNIGQYRNDIYLRFTVNTCLCSKLNNTKSKFTGVSLYCFIIVMAKSWAWCNMVCLLLVWFYCQYWSICAHHCCVVKLCIYAILITRVV